MHPQQTQYERLIVALADLRDRGRLAIAQAQAARRASHEAQDGAEQSTKLPPAVRDEPTDGG